MTVFCLFICPKILNTSTVTCQTSFNLNETIAYSMLWHCNCTSYLDMTWIICLVNQKSQWNYKFKLDKIQQIFYLSKWQQKTQAQNSHRNIRNMKKKHAEDITKTTQLKWSTWWNTNKIQMKSESDNVCVNRHCVCINEKNKKLVGERPCFKWNGEMETTFKIYYRRKLKNNKQSHLTLHSVSSFIFL